MTGNTLVTPVDEKSHDVAIHVRRALGLLQRLYTDSNEKTTQVGTMHQISPAGRIRVVTLHVDRMLDLVDVIRNFEVVCARFEQPCSS
jgi:hypothetical protein